MPSSAQVPSQVDCNNAAGQPAVSQALAVTGYLYATSQAERNRLIDGRWHTYSDASPDAVSVADSLISAAPSYSSPTGGSDAGTSRFHAATPCTLPNGQVTVANC